MLVTFTSSATSDLVMFDDVAGALLEIIGKAPTSRGVLMPEEFAEALRRLTAIPTEIDEPAAAAAEADAEAGSEPHARVGLGVRAYPLIGMIRQAAAEPAAPILWHAASDFQRPA